MAFYLRRKYEAVPDEKLVCTDALTTTTALTPSGSASFVGADTVDIATLRTQIQAIETAVNEIVTLLGG